MRQAAGARLPPELSVLAVVVRRGRGSRRLARPGADVPHPAVVARRLAEGRDVARQALGAVVVPHPRARVARRRVVSGLAADLAALVLPFKVAERALGVVDGKVKGDRWGSSGDEKGSSRGKSGETHGGLGLDERTERF